MAWHDDDEPANWIGGMRNVDANDLEAEYGLGAVRDALDRAEYTTRRRAQQQENIEIGEGSDIVPTARLCNLNQMLEDFVFIKDGSQVAPLECPKGVLPLADFKNTMAASKQWVEHDGKKREFSTSKLWLESPNRMEADAITFRAGGLRITAKPDSGRAALNLWTEPKRLSAPSDWMQRAEIFVRHVKWLWGHDGDAFLDWLAHIEQRPGILPHYGWVHISREHGKGRNWISSVLTRVWTGYVAASLDLIPLLSGGFNGRISRKLLAIVDEINEGGNSSYQHAQKLRQLVTEEHRDINPKYGRKRHEYNSCRWLMFSNHTGALPLTANDRRFWIVAHDGKVKESDYYANLYKNLADPLFICSVAELLRQRDLRNFRPGDRPPINQAKAELIAFSETEDDSTLQRVVERWPVDLITGLEITGLLGDGGSSRPAVRHAMDRAGIRKFFRKVRIDGQGVQNIYIIRNSDRWAAGSNPNIKLELARSSLAEKEMSLEPDEE